MTCEPSDAVMLQSDYGDLLSDTAADLLGEHTYGVCEYVDVHRLDGDLTFGDAGAEPLVYHGHCHQKATGRDHHAVGVLRRAGYEAEHYSMSQAIGQLLFERVDGTAGAPVAPGASCRTQLGDREGGREPDHPVERLADALDG